MLVSVALFPSPFWVCVCFGNFVLSDYRPALQGLRAKYYATVTLCSICCSIRFDRCSIAARGLLERPSLEPRGESRTDTPRAALDPVSRFARRLLCSRSIARGLRRFPFRFARGCRSFPRERKRTVIRFPFRGRRRRRRRRRPPCGGRASPPARLHILESLEPGRNLIPNLRVEQEGVEPSCHSLPTCGFRCDRSVTAP